MLGALAFPELVTYTAVRAAGWATGWIEADSESLPWLDALDGLVLFIPAALVLTNLSGVTRDRIGKLAYLGSVCLLYTGFLPSMRFGLPAIVVLFAGAGSMFHAVEYFAIVTH